MRRRCRCGGGNGRSVKPAMPGSVLGCSLVLLVPATTSLGRVDSTSKPNVVLIVTDDQRWDSLDQMPALAAAPGWARFSNAFVDEPQCCPSRAGIFTGRYPQHTGGAALRDGPKRNHKRKGGGLPARGERGSCEGSTSPKPPNLNVHDTVSEPSWMSAEQPVNAVNMQFQRAATCEALGGVDQAVMSILTELERTDRLENTYVIFTSDNGYAFGEHRLVGKGGLYQASVRVPLLVRGPGVQAGTVDRLTSNVDFVPTILDSARVRPPRH